MTSYIVTSQTMYVQYHRTPLLKTRIW